MFAQSPTPSKVKSTFTTPEVPSSASTTSKIITSTTPKILTSTTYAGKVTCIAIPPYINKGHDEWCTMNCNLGNCPSNMCSCHPAD
jgi:hypothetical protein